MVTNPIKSSKKKGNKLSAPWEWKHSLTQSTNIHILIHCWEQWGQGNYKQRRLQMKWNLSSVTQYFLNQGLKLRLKYFSLPELQGPHSDRNKLTVTLKKMQKIWITGNLLSPQILGGNVQPIENWINTLNRLFT